MMDYYIIAKRENVMGRIEENESVRKCIDDELGDIKIAVAILEDPEKAVPVAAGCIVPLLMDISKSLAVIADNMTKGNNNA